MRDFSQTYQTSEKIRVEFETAGVLLRFAAYVVDIIIQSLITGGILFVLMFVMMGGACLRVDQSNDSAFMTTVLVVFLIILAILITSFQMIFELLWKGQTPGKRILHIRVVQDNGSAASPLSIILRNIFRMVDFLPVANLAGAVCALVNKDKKRIGDLVAGTIVIREKPAKLPDFRKFAGADNLFTGMEAKLKADFSDDERKVIEDYFEARDFLYETNHFHSIKDLEKEMLEWLEPKTGVKCPAGVEKGQYIGALNAVISGYGGNDGPNA
ncbi:MAG: hypothetical protein A2Y33_06745 [Spirochaetes bacterium GWF1_51_8]|nr:MAG: hypothetical protein A2Y33_06745 [Spirochaetes bacterium GWF1_51_8]